MPTRSICPFFASAARGGRGDTSLLCFFFPGALVGVAAEGEAGVEQLVRFRILVSSMGLIKAGTSWSHPRRRIQSVQTACMRCHRNLRSIACTTRSLHSASFKRARREPCSLWRSASRRCRRLPPASALLCASSCFCSPFFRVGSLWRGSGFLFRSFCLSRLARLLCSSRPRKPDRRASVRDAFASLLLCQLYQLAEPAFITLAQPE